MCAISLQPPLLLCVGDGLDDIGLASTARELDVMLLGVILELGNRHLGEIDIGLLGRSGRLRLLLGGLLGGGLSGLCRLLGLGRLLCGSLLGRRSSSLGAVHVDDAKAGELLAMTARALCSPCAS